MQRRELLKWAIAGLMGADIPWRADAMTPDEIKQRVQDYRRKALEHFPLKLIETTGGEALAKWQELKSAGQGYPVVLGWRNPTDPLGNLLMPFGPRDPNVPPPPSVEDILKAAAGIDFPGDLAKRKKAESETAFERFEAALKANPNMPLPIVTGITQDGKAQTQTRGETLAQMQQQPREPPLGEWPAAPHPSLGLSITRDLRDMPLPKVYIGLAPTDDWTTIPAYLRWGGWNDCPAAEYHVAAMRTWRDRYGAELVGMNFDTINMRVAKKPKTRDEALMLAHDQHVYAPDIIDQGVFTFSALAADLMANDWWFFWWD